MSALACDVLVAGGGPAGSALAALLAGAGASVILCEKARFPREKLCGEFLSPDGVACVERLGLGDALRCLGPSRIESFLVSAPGARESLQRELPAPALGLSRRSLDELLLRHAQAEGADVREGCRVLSVAGAPRGLRVACEIAGRGESLGAKAVLDATGRLGGVRVEGDAPEAPERAGQVGLQEHRVAASPFPRRVELHAFRGGYVGLNAVEGGRVTCCTLASAERLRRAGSPEGLLDEAAKENAMLRERLATLGPRDGELRSTARSTRRRRRSGVALTIGDAAGMIAPACGDGMSMALRSAELAAPLVLAHLAGLSWDETRRRWEASLQAEMSRRLRWGRALEAALLRPWSARAMVGAGRLLPGIADAVARATRG